MSTKYLIVVGILASLAACSEAPESPRSNAAVSTDRATGDTVEIGSLAAQLERSAGIRAVKRLQHAYALYVSAGEWDRAAALFAQNGSARFADETIAAADLATWLERNYGSAGDRDGWLGEQLIFSPVINIDAGAERAEGRWRLVAMLGKFGAQARWLGGTFENTYVNNDGVWQIESLRLYPVYGGNYADGWRMLKEETPETVAPIPYHFTVTQAGQPHLPASDGEVAMVTAASEATLASIDARAARLLDEDRIVSLQNALGYYMDRHMWDDAAELFSDDATLQIGTKSTPVDGIARGAQAIRNALGRLGTQPLPVEQIDERLQLHTVVDVAADGMSASARGTELRMFGEFRGDAFWGINTFSNRYVKTDGHWRVDAVEITPRMQASYSDGWAQPSARQAGAWPAFNVPAFEFPHPVLDTRTGSVHGSDSSASIADVERNLRVLNAYEGAENVSNAYGYYIDEFLWDPMADVFSIDGWKELSYIGTYVGRERVRESVVSRYGRGGRRPNSMTFHQKTQPVITVAADGRSAQIRTRLFQLNASTENPGSYISGIYENRIVNENGVWKISAMDLDYAWLANYVGGWANVEPGSSQRFAPAPGSLQGAQAPDRPLRGVTFAPYPEAPLDMAFHYVNPVSGRRPPVYLPEEY